MSGVRSSRGKAWRGAPRCACRCCLWPMPVRRRPARAAVVTWFRVIETVVPRRRADAPVAPRCRRRFGRGDQAAHIGFLDGVGNRDPPQRRHVEWFSDGQCVDHLADGLRQRTETGFDQFDQSLRNDRFTCPTPVAVPLG